MIEVEKITKVYGSNLVLDNVSFTVGENEIVGFLGPNGAGKSTTMNIMTGYISCNSGSVKIDGMDITEKPNEAKRQIGFLPEIPPLYPEMKVREYLNFVYELKRCPFPREAHVDEILSVCKIRDVQNRLIGNLSKGYKQRVGIAQALVGNPKTLIFDEPTVGLDPKQIIEVRNLIRTLGRTHSVILSTHILSEVQSVADRIVIINGGKILADEKAESITNTVNEKSKYLARICGPQNEVISAVRGVEGVASVVVSADKERDSFAYHIETDNGYEMRKNLFFAMSKAGYPVIELSKEGSSLEEVFIKLTDAKAAKMKGGNR